MAEFPEVALAVAGPSPLMLIEVAGPVEPDSCADGTLLPVHVVLAGRSAATAGAEPPTPIAVAVPPAEIEMAIVQRHAAAEPVPSASASADWPTAARTEPGRAPIAADTNDEMAWRNWLVLGIGRFETSGMPG
jgi:hypothetical protein